MQKGIRRQAMVHVDCRATSDSTAQVSSLARIGRPPTFGFRRRAVVIAQTGRCLHQKMGSMRSHTWLVNKTPFKRAKSAANSAKTSGTLTYMYILI